MNPRDPEIYDRAPACVSIFNFHMGKLIRSLITDALISEHQRRPNGPHSESLARVLNFFRRASVVGKYSLYADRPFAAYRVIVLTGVRGQTPRFVEDKVYPSEEAAAHAVFLRRVAEPHACPRSRCEEDGRYLHRRVRALDTLDQGRR